MELVLSFQHMGPKDLTQVKGIGGKCLYSIILIALKYILYHNFYHLLINFRFCQFLEVKGLNKERCPGIRGKDMVLVRQN